MNIKTRICLYLIALSYIITELIKIWESRYVGTTTGFPIYLIIPLIPISIGLVIDLIIISTENEYFSHFYLLNNTS